MKSLMVRADSAWGGNGVIVVALLILLIFALHGGALRYPLVFSDLYWYGPTNRDVLGGALFRPRFITKKLAHYLLQFGGGQTLWLHVSAVALHALVAIGVFFLLRRMLGAVLVDRLPAAEGGG